MNGLKQLWFNGSIDEWEEAISDYYNDANVKKTQEIENYLLSLTAENVRDMSANEFYNYLHDFYFVWKYTGTWLPQRRKDLSYYSNNNKMDELERIHKKLFHDFEFDRTDTEGLLCTLTRIQGLGIAGASGLLSFLAPQFYGTLDRLVVASLQFIYPDDKNIQNIKGNDLSFNDGVFLESILRNKAESMNKNFNTETFSPRIIDMVLWNKGHNIK